MATLQRLVITMEKSDMKGTNNSATGSITHFVPHRGQLVAVHLQVPRYNNSASNKADFYLDELHGDYEPRRLWSASNRAADGWFYLENLSKYWFNGLLKYQVAQASKGMSIMTLLYLDR